LGQARRPKTAYGMHASLHSVFNNAKLSEFSGYPNFTTTKSNNRYLGEDESKKSL